MRENRKRGGLLWDFLEWLFLYCRGGYDLAMYCCMVMGCDES